MMRGAVKFISLRPSHSNLRRIMLLFAMISMAVYINVSIGNLLHNKSPSREASKPSPRSLTEKPATGLEGLESMSVEKEEEEGKDSRNSQLIYEVDSNPPKAQSNVFVGTAEEEFRKETFQQGADLVINMMRHAWWR